MQTVTITLHAEFNLPDDGATDDFWESPEGVRDWYAGMMRESEGCARVYARVDRRPMAADGLPADVQIAIDHLADVGSQWARDRHPDFPFHDLLRDWIAGAVQAQVEDPDWDQAADSANYMPIPTATIPCPPEEPA